MKTKQLFTIALACVMLICLAVPAWATPPKMKMTTDRFRKRLPRRIKSKHLSGRSNTLTEFRQKKARNRFTTISTLHVP